MISLQDQVKCIQRELRMRHFVYPDRVRKGTMTQWDMDHEIACMRAVLEHLQGQDRQPSLFESEVPHVR